MKNVLAMAGNYASHAIWSVSDGETLIPIVGYLKTDGELSMARLMMGSAEAMSQGTQKISQLGSEFKGATFITDAMVTLDSGKTDCLIVNIRFAEDDSKSIQFMIPYRNANHEKGFAIHRLKISELKGFESDDLDWITEAFMQGLESHEEGGKIWQEQYEDQAGEGAVDSGSENTEFTVDEFEKLKNAPFLIFFLVAAADGKIDKKEVQEFIKVLQNPDILKNPLMNRIITNVIADIPGIITAIASKEINYIEELKGLQTIVEKHLPDTEANQFKIVLLMIGKKIAEASGGFLGFGSKISKEEKTALAGIALGLGIKLQ